MISRLSGHIGDNAAALVDGQLSAEAAERAWRHVLGCPGCRQIVEYEAWVKRQVGALTRQPDAWTPMPSNQLLGNLHSVEHQTTSAMASDETKPRATSVVVGAGAAGVLMAGMLIIGVASVGQQPRTTPDNSSRTASISNGALGLITGRTARIGDDVRLPEAQSGRHFASVSWRLPR